MVFEIARLLKTNGDTPVLLHFGSGYIKEFAKLNDIESHTSPNRQYYKKSYLLPLFALRTKKFIRKLNLDCLHSHLFGPIIAFAPLAWLIRLPHVGTLHDVYMIEDAPRRILLIKFAAILKTQLVAVSKPMRAFYQRAANFSEDKIAYIPNATPKNKQLQQRASIRKQLQLKDTDTAVFTVGRLVSLKRFDILINAMAYIKENSAIKTFIVGAGPEKMVLQQLINKLNIPDRVMLLGERNDVYELLAAADIFTLTSETEGMSKSILEALASNLPVIATDVGGNQDLVHHDDNGYLINDHSPETLSLYIEKLAQDKTLRLEMGKNSQLLLEQEYNPELFLLRHLNIYKKVTNKK